MGGVNYNDMTLVNHVRKQTIDGRLSKNISVSHERTGVFFLGWGLACNMDIIP